MIAPEECRMVHAVEEYEINRRLRFMKIVFSSLVTLYFSIQFPYANS